MKKFYTLLIGAALPLLAYADAKQLPYESLFCQDDDWVPYDVNNDGSTWTDEMYNNPFNSSGYKEGKKYCFSGNAANDWLIGPAVSLEAGKDYKVKFWRKATNDSFAEKLKLFIGTANTPDGLLEGTELVKIEDAESKGKYYAAAFTVPVSGEYYFGFYCYSDANKFNQYITGFQVREDVFTPAAPGNLTVTEGAERALKATLTWTLPVADIDGIAFTDGFTYDEVRIFRDGVQLSTPNLAADATEFVDGQDYGLTSGKHTYSVVCVVNGAASGPATVTSKYIGPLDPMALPFNAATDTWGSWDDFQLFWSVDKGRDSDTSKEWTYNAGNTYTQRNVNYYPYSYSNPKSMDEWLISPELKFTEAGVYRVTISGKYQDDDYKMTLYTGNGTTLGSYTDKFGEHDGQMEEDKPLYFYIKVDAPVNRSIAIHAYCEEPSWSTLYFYDVKVEKWHLAPAQISDLTAEVTSDGESVLLKWTTPALANTGEALSSPLSKQVVYCDGELLATLTDADNLTPGAAVTYTHETPQAGVHTYYVEVYMGEDMADGSPMTVTSAWVGDETQPVPYNTYFSIDDSTRSIWTAYDANDDGLTFVMPQPGVAGKPTLKKVTEYTEHDDYLLSPYFNIEKAGHYDILWNVSGGAKNYLLETGYVSDKTDVTGTFTKIGEDFAMNGNYSAINFQEGIDFDAPGRYALALHTVKQHNPATSDDKNIEISRFEISYVPVNPNKPENFTASAAPDSELKVVLKWTNPTESNFEGVTPVIAKAVISRKQGSAMFEQVAEITEGLVAGGEFTWTDETLTTPGIYTYQVVLHGPESYNPGAYAQAITTWVGPGKTLPVSINIDTATDPNFNSTDWSIYNVNGDTNMWGGITWEASGSSVSITSNNSSDTNDWAIHGFYQFDKGDEYKFTVRNSTTNDTTTDWELWLGDSDHYDGMYVKVADITTPATSWTNVDHSYILVVSDQEENATGESDDAGTGDEELPRINVRPGATAIGLHLAKPGQVSFKAFAIEVIKRAVKSVELSETEAELTIGGTMSLTATVMPEDATDKTVTWTSSDEAVATVDADGNVTAVAPGQVEITATSNGISAVCALTVKPVVAESVTLSETEAELTEGETLRLTAEVAPEDTTDKTVAWTSSDEEVATVDAAGLVTAVAPGQATITAACGEASATCDVTVLARVIEVTGITLDETEIFGAPGNTQQLTATVVPEDATDKTVTWTSSDEAVATVDADGLVTFVADGEAVITAACGEFTATCTVKVLTNGIALIPADMRNEARVYTLQGVEVKPENLTPGFYIVTFLRDGQRVASKIRL